MPTQTSGIGQMIALIKRMLYRRRKLRADNEAICRYLDEVIAKEMPKIRINADNITA